MTSFKIPAQSKLPAMLQTLADTKPQPTRPMDHINSLPSAIEAVDALFLSCAKRQLSAFKPN